MRYASDSSGSTSATTERAPSPRSAASRWCPFGVQYPSRERTTVIGSMKRSSRPITSARRRTCVSDKSRWNGVGSTLSIGRAARTCQCPPNGSR